MIEPVTRTQRQIQKEVTRRHIIETAVRYVADNGFSFSRTADIARAAGVSHGTIFAHFSTQSALFSAVIEEFGKRVTLRLHELAAGNGSLREVLEAHLKALTEYEAFYTRLVNEGRLLPPEARHTFILIQSCISFHISQSAEKEMAAGLLANCPLHLLFNTWVGLVHYYLSNNDLFAPSGSVLPRYGRQLVEHFMSLVAAKI
jgi:AcrR family transcriptional regulator